jgi:hypothetical protein
VTDCRDQEEYRDKINDMIYKIYGMINKIYGMELNSHSVVERTDTMTTN